MITREDVKKIADLARLDVKEEELDKYAAELSRIMGLAERLKSIDVTGVKPTAHAVEVTNVFRPDVSENANVIGKIIEQAPLAEPPFYRVPKVL